MRIRRFAVERFPKSLELEGVEALALAAMMAEWVLRRGRKTDLFDLQLPYNTFNRIILIF